MTYAPAESRHYFAQLQVYQSMPDDELLNIQHVYLNTPIKNIISRAGVRVNCETCGEENINERAIIIDGRVLCRACGWGGYYASVEQNPPQIELSQTWLELVDG